MRALFLHNRFRALFAGWFLSQACLIATAALAQTQKRTVSIADSLVASAADSSLLEWSTASEYEILRLRVQRWLTGERAPVSAVFTHVTELLQEAESMAGAEDYVTAQVLLETALDLISTAASTSASLPVLAENEYPSSSFTKAPQRWQIQQEVLAGVDLSRLEYELGNPEFDQIIADISTRSINNSGNPFAGIKFQLMRTPAARANVRMLALLKVGRDYDNGILEFLVRHPLGRQAALHFENDFEATAYRAETDLRYWQNASLLRLGMNLGRDFSVEMENELRVRRYREETNYGPNYYQNEIGLGASYGIGVATRILGRYDYGVRTHARFPVNDYVEHRFDASISQNTSQLSSFFIQNIWRTRTYPAGIPDSTFQNTYQEEFLRADLRFGLSAKLALRVEGDLTLRQYSTPNTLTPDFFNARLNPQLEQKIHADVQISAGYLFLLQVHGAREQQNPTPPAAALTTGFYEDYYAHGLTLGLDWFSTRNILLSLSHTYEVRTYPHDPLKDSLFPSLYSDYNNHSLLLFLSWKMSAHWLASAVANYDNQTSRTATGDDLRNTLFSFEVAYSF